MKKHVGSNQIENVYNNISIKLHNLDKLKNFLNIYTLKMGLDMEIFDASQPQCLHFKKGFTLREI